MLTILMLSCRCRQSHSVKLANPYSRFDEVLNAKGLILDVRDNGGGSSENGYAIIARLIDKATSQT